MNSAEQDTKLQKVQSTDDNEKNSGLSKIGTRGYWPLKKCSLNDVPGSKSERFVCSEAVMNERSLSSERPNWIIDKIASEAKQRRFDETSVDATSTSTSMSTLARKQTN